MQKSQLHAEPPEVVEATVIAALNLNYPGSRLSVHVLDDGNSPALKDMITRLQFQARWGGVLPLEAAVCT